MRSSRKRGATVAQARSWVAVDAQFRNSAGAMGGSPRANHKRDRQQFKRDLKKGEYDG